MNARIAIFAGLLGGALLGIASPALAQNEHLNVSIEVFEPGLPEDASTYRELDVFPRIRQFESLLLPFAVRKTLAESNEWGAVRVIPEPDPAAELLISGRILKSDGLVLELQLTATDASGRIWVDKHYIDAPADRTNSDESLTGALVFHNIFDAFAGDLAQARDGLDAKTLGQIADISMMRHASILLPSAFADYLSQADDGTWTLQRLPAEDDPMLERIRRIRGVEYVMTDAVDEKFEQLHGDIARTYDFWREYRREYAQYLVEEANWQASDRSEHAPGSFLAVERAYDNYRWARMAEQEQRKWAAAFDNEVGPAVERVESRVAELDDWVDDNYAEWQRLLAEIFSLETGVNELP